MMAKEAGATLADPPALTAGTGTVTVAAKVTGATVEPC